MNILINATNLNTGGGIQVGDSIIRGLQREKTHNFVVVYHSMLKDAAEAVRDIANVKTYCYCKVWSEGTVWQKTKMMLWGTTLFSTDWWQKTTLM